MDWLLEYVLWGVIVVYAVGGLLLLLCLLARLIVWLLRLVPYFGERLRPTAEFLAALLGPLMLAPLAVFLVGALLLPFLVVAIPVIVVGAFLMRLAVPSQMVAVRTHGRADQWWPSFATMNWPLRLITVTTLAQVLAAAAILWVLKSPAAPVIVETVHGQTIEIDRAVVLATGVFLAIGFGFALAGAWVTPFSRVLIFLIFVATSRPMIWQGAPLFVWAGTVGFLTLPMAATLLTRLRARARKSDDLVAFGITLAAALAVFYILTERALDAAGGNYAAFLNRQITELAIALTPVLFMAGTDIADIGERIGLRLGTLTRWGREGWVAALGAAAVAAGGIAAVAIVGEIDYSGLLTVVLIVVGGAVVYGLLFGMINARERWGRPAGCLVGLVAVPALIVASVFLLLPSVILSLVALVAVAAALAGLFARTGMGGWRSYRIPFAAMAVIALLLAGTRETLNIFSAFHNVPPGVEELKFEVRGSEGPPAVSISIPDTWSMQRLSEEGGVLFSGGEDFYAQGAMVLATLPLETGRDLNFDKERAVASIWPQLWTRMEQSVLGAGLSGFIRYDLDGFEWSHAENTYVDQRQRYNVRVFTRINEGEWWVVITLSGARYSSYFDPLFNIMVASLRPGFLDEPIMDEFPAVDLSRRVTEVSGFGFLPILFAPLGLLFLFVRFWPETPLLRPQWKVPSGTPIEVGGLLAVIVAATAVFFLPNTELLNYWGPPQAQRNPLATLQIFVAAGTLAVVGVAILLRAVSTFATFLRDLIALNVALFALLFTYWFFGATISAGQRHLELEISAFIVFLLWDFIRSGEQITNVDGTVFRRPARIMAYLGYIALASTAALFFAAQSVSGSAEPIAKVLEGEEIARQGIVWLGTPVLLLSFMLRWNAALQSQADAEHPPSTVEGAAAPPA